MPAGYGRSDNVRAVKPGSPSVTAQKVALQRLSFDRVPAPYGDPDADLALARDVASDATVDGESPLSEYLAARTVFFDRVVVSARSIAGMTQAVIVGAGYDGRALRYAKPGVRWFEVDHPATQHDKRERLDRLGHRHRRDHLRRGRLRDRRRRSRSSPRGLRPRHAPRSSSAKESRCTSSDRCSSRLLQRSIRAVATERSRFAISFSMTPDRRRGRGSPGVVPRAGSRRSESPNAIGSRPRRGLASSRTRAGKTRPPAHARSARDWWSCHLLRRRWRQPPKTPLLPSMSNDVTGPDLRALRRVVLAHLGVFDAVGVGDAVDVEACHREASGSVKLVDHAAFITFSWVSPPSMAAALVSVSTDLEADVVPRQDLTVVRVSARRRTSRCRPCTATTAGSSAYCGSLGSFCWRRR